MSDEAAVPDPIATAQVTVDLVFIDGRWKVAAEETTETVPNHPVPLGHSLAVLLMEATGHSGYYMPGDSWRKYAFGEWLRA